MKKSITNLVIGSEGFIGKPFCNFLESQGEQVVRFDIKRGEHEDARKVTLPLHGIDRVYFIAWDVGGAKYLFKKEALNKQLVWNTELLMNVMPQLEKAGIPFFFLSSQFAEEYGTPYGATKRLGEIWTKLIPHGHYARQWNAYGVIEMFDERSHVIGDFIHQAVTTGVIKMLSNGQEHRQFVHLEDSFKAYHKVLRDGIKGEIYDIASGEWVKILDLATIIAELTGADVEPGEASFPDHRTFPFNKPVPGWKPEISLKEGLKKLVTEYRKLKVK
jgi:nucleoside-diphosphate-sugar epimerase